ncbi:MAG: helix-turn-helix domain-containing protein, partial [Clostridia bacterium]|nr:helix-turn-helix domain-containing protein [Clostridia bacterium]
MNTIGERIKDLRKKEGLSLKELADRVDTTSSFLSQVENNKTALSLSALKKVSEALNSTMSYILGETTEESIPLNFQLIKKNERRTLKNIGEGLKLQFLSTLDNSNLLEPTIHILQPRTVSGIPPYKHDGEEIIYVLEGQIEFILADRIIEMHKYYLNKIM